MKINKSGMNKFPLLIMALMLMAIISCDNEDETPRRDTHPFVYMISPIEGHPGDVVTIQGRNFSTARENNTVLFNDAQGIVLEASSTRLQVAVPEGEGLQSVQLHVNGLDAEGEVMAFNYVEPNETYMVSTLAGNSEYGLVDGVGEAAYFRNPEGVTMHPSGYLIVTDRTNNSIRQVQLDGTVTTVLGTGASGYLDGPVSQALLDYPWKSCVDNEGNIYIADRDNHAIRKIDTSGNVSTLAGTGESGFVDGPGDQAQFNQPLDITVDADGVLYVADNLNHSIRKVMPDGTVSTVAGGASGHEDGSVAEAQFRNPSGLDIDDQHHLYVADRINHLIRKIDLNAGQVSTVAGDGTQGTRDGQLLQAQFNNPYGIAVGGNGELIVADLSNHKIRLIDSEGVSTMAGSVSGFLDGIGITAQFYNPTDITYADGIVYVTDLGNHRIRKIVKE